MTYVSRRSFLASSAAAAATAGSLLNSTEAAEDIPGFDQTTADSDRTKVWQPFSARKVRLETVGHGVCRFGLAFELQHHPNVELVAVSDLFPDRCADMTLKIPQYSSYLRRGNGGKDCRRTECSITRCDGNADFATREAS